VNALFVNFGSLVDMLLTASVIPMALIGGVFALYASGEQMEPAE
jgi:cobalt-zinc-cadmium resistance protein CzcA